VRDPRPALASGLAATGAAAAIVFAGGIDPEVLVLAAIGGLVFGDLAGRACREPPPARPDATDLATSLAFLGILVAAAFDVGRAAGSSRGNGLARAAGLPIIAAGLVLRARAIEALGANFGVRLGVRSDQAFVDAGPYRWIRHPNYTGLMLVACGTALSLWSPFALATAVCLWLPVMLVRVAREERLMLERFGGRYRAYMSRTWRLIVGLY
jgi:protein-S-isoprenylcysteine O-methyltransferase Ste14